MDEENKKNTPAGAEPETDIESEVFGPEDIKEYPEDPEPRQEEPIQDTEKAEAPEEDKKTVPSWDNKDREIQRLQSKVEGLYIFTGMLLLFLFVLIMLPGHSLKNIKPAKLTASEPVEAERIVQEPERPVYPRRIYPPEPVVRIPKAEAMRLQAYRDMLQMQEMLKKMEARYGRVFEELERMDTNGDGVVHKEYRFKMVPGKLILSDEDGVHVYNF